jgi:ADP-heptose:LPS heptosyltransferase
MAPRKRILIINVNWVGDVLFTTPFIRAVREAYPESYIACLVHPRCRDMLDGNPRLDEIIIYDEGGSHKGLSAKALLVLSLRKRRFDTVFILHRSFTKAVIAFLTGAKERIGYPTKRRSLFLTTAIDEPEEETHKVEYFLTLAAGAGIRARDRSYEFFIKDGDRDYIRNFLKAEGVGEDATLIVICPGGNWDPKRWPKENFARASDMLAEEFGATIAIAGAS